MLPGDVAEKDARVQVLAAGVDFQLQHEVAQRMLELQLTWPVLHADGVLGRDRKLALLAGKLLPAGQIPAIEDRLQFQRLELDVAKLDRPGVELQADQPATERPRVDVVERALAVDGDGEMAGLGLDREGVPLAGGIAAFGLLATHEAAGGKWADCRLGDVQLVAIGGRVGGFGGRAQEDAAVGIRGARKSTLST